MNNILHLDLIKFLYDFIKYSTHRFGIKCKFHMDIFKTFYGAFLLFVNLVNVNQHKAKNSNFSLNYLFKMVSFQFLLNKI